MSGTINEPMNMSAVTEMPERETAGHSASGASQGHAHHGKASGPANKKSLFDAAIVKRAVVDSLKKLNPVLMMKNPVMFVVEVGSVVTTLLLFGHGGHSGFNLQITLWLWFTVLFANFAEAMAEGRGKAQADALRKAKSETTAYKLKANGEVEEIPSSHLR
ncbi:MAG TPA: hypothetical protein VGN01_01970, partial [Acidobacteriaceae bacterium]